MPDLQPSSPFLLGVKNEGYPASLETRKVYRSLADPGVESRGFVRLVDESGDDYLYPAPCFVAVELSAAAALVFAEAS